MGFSLSMVTAEGTERPFALNKPRMVIGRDTRCDLLVPLPKVGARHCEIIIEGAALKLRDLGSVEGTLHNGSRVAQADLCAGDRVTVGPVTFIVRIDVTRHEGAGGVEITTQVQQVDRSGAPQRGPESGDEGESS